VFHSDLEGLVEITMMILIEVVALQGIIADPEVNVPERVRRNRQEGKILVMFYGPAYNKVLHLVYSTNVA
jgi:hypothetical protein